MVNILGFSSLIIVEICFSIGSILSFKVLMIETYVEISKSLFSSWWPIEFLASSLSLANFA